MFVSKVGVRAAALAARRGISTSRSASSAAAVVAGNAGENAGGGGSSSGGSSGSSSRGWGRMFFQGLKLCGTGTYTALAFAPAAYYIYLDLDRAKITEEHLMRPRSLRELTHFFGRDEEMRTLQALFEQTPDRIMILTGPSDAGKSTLLNHVLSKRPGAVKIDLRERPVSSVNDFVRFFNEQMAVKFLLFRSWVVDFLPISGGENLVVKEALNLQDFAISLQCVTAALERIAADNRRRGISRPPVICIDEFNTLFGVVRSSPDGRDLVQSLLNWAVHVTKERHLAHVVIASSDAFIIEALDQFSGIHGRYRFFRLGDLPRARALEYVRMRIPTTSASDAEMIVDAVGGRFMHLNNAINEVISGRSARDVIKGMVASQRERLLKALLAPQEEDDDDDDDDGNAAAGPAWKPRQLQAALEMLASSKGGFVDYHQIKNEVFDGDEAPMRALIRDDLLGFRAGKTADLEGAERHVFYLTPDSPLELYAYRQLAGTRNFASRIRSANERTELREQEQALRDEEVELEAEQKQISVERDHLTIDIDLFAKTSEHIYWSNAYSERRKALAEKSDAIRQKEEVLEKRREAARKKLSSVQKRLAEIEKDDGGDE
eukprot:tig00020554_g10941.t1